MSNNDQDPLEINWPRKQPWFGPKRFGVGYGPRTWQGYLTVAILVLVAILIATVARHHHSPLAWLGVLPLVAVPLGIMLVQRR
jgi:hypothetical protein